MKLIALLFIFSSFIATNADDRALNQLNNYNDFLNSKQEFSLKGKVEVIQEFDLEKLKKMYGESFDALMGSFKDTKEIYDFSFKANRNNQFTYTSKSLKHYVNAYSDGDEILIDRDVFENVMQFNNKLDHKIVESHNFNVFLGFPLFSVFVLKDGFKKMVITEKGKYTSKGLSKNHIIVSHNNGNKHTLIFSKENQSLKSIEIDTTKMMNRSFAETGMKNVTIKKSTVKFYLQDWSYQLSKDNSFLLKMPQRKKKKNMDSSLKY